MAIVTVVGVSISSTSNAASYATATFTPSANDFLLVFCGASGTNDLLFTISDSQSLGFTKVAAGTTLYNSAGDIVLCATANKLAAAQVTALTISFPNNSATGANLVIVRVSGGDGTYVRQAKTAIGAGGTTPIITFDDIANTNNTVITAVSAVSPSTHTAPTGFTRIFNQFYSTPATSLGIAKIDTGFAQVGVTWGASTANAWGGMAIEIYASGSMPSQLDPMGSESGFFGVSGGL